MKGGLYGCGDDDEPESGLQAGVFTYGRRDIWLERFGRDAEEDFRWV